MSTRFMRAGVVSTVIAAGTVLAPGVAAADAVAPSVPGNLRVQSVSSTSATLAWAPSTDDSGWAFYEVEARAGSSSVIRNAATEPAKTLTELKPGLTYTASVVAIDGSGNRSTPISAQFTTPVDATPPTTPANLRPIMSGGKLSAITWNAATDSSRFIYVLRSSGNSIYGTESTTATSHELVIQDCIVLPGSTHTVTVEARDFHGNISGRSNAITVTFPPA